MIDPGECCEHSRGMAEPVERYDMGQRNPYTPQEIKPPNSGPRASMGRLLALVDTDDPAFTCIAEVLKDMQAAGIELNAETVSMAVSLGRQKRARSRSLGHQSQDGPAPNGSIVYYIRRGTTIKIGTTITPVNRFRALMPDEILAFEPGGPDEEFSRHMQFLHLRIGPRGEYFHPGDDLVAHVSQMLERHGAPDPSWPSLARQRSKGDALRAEVPPPTSEQTATIAEGSRILGIKAFTAYGWARRGRMPVAGLDEQQRKLYYLEHMAYLQRLHEPWRHNFQKVAE